MLKRFFVAAVLVSVCSTAGFAQTQVYDNAGGAAADNYIVSDSTGFIPGSSVDDVVLAASAAITGIEFSGNYARTPLSGDDTVAATDDNITVNFWASDATGALDAASLTSFAIGNATTRTAGATAGTFDYTADLGAGINLNAGDTYWVAILNNTTADADTFQQGVVIGAGDAFGTFDVAAFGGLNAQTYATDFQLIGTVDSGVIPEPSSAALLALGFAGLFTRRRR